MAWEIKWETLALKQLGKLDKQIEKKIISYVEDRVVLDPKGLGKALTGNKSGLWRYRVQDFRIICRLEDEKLIVLVVEVGHRKDVYD